MYVLQLFFYEPTYYKYDTKTSENNHFRVCEKFDIPNRQRGSEIKRVYNKEFSIPTPPSVFDACN